MGIPNVYYLSREIALYKPGECLEENLEDYENLFGSPNKGCYLAPERLVKGNSSHLSKTKEMDVFSLAISVIEVILDGEQFFTLPKLLEYRVGKYDLFNVLKEKLKMHQISDELEITYLFGIIKQMISLDPSNRSSADKIMDSSEFKMFYPNCFWTLLYPIISTLARPTLSQPDYKMGMMINFKDAYWKLLIKKASPYIINKINPLIEDFVKKLCQYNQLYLQVNLSLRGTNSCFLEESKFNPHKEDNDCIIIVLRILTSQIQYCAYPSTKLAIKEFSWELVKCMFSSMHFGFILDCFIEMLKDSSKIVQAQALSVCLNILEKSFDLDTPLDILLSTYDYFILKLSESVDFHIGNKESAENYDEDLQKEYSVTLLDLLFSKISRILCFNDKWYTFCYQKMETSKQKKISELSESVDKLYYHTKALLAIWVIKMHKYCKTGNMPTFYSQMAAYEIYIESYFIINMTEFKCTRYCRSCILMKRSMSRGSHIYSKDSQTLKLGNQLKIAS